MHFYFKIWKRSCLKDRYFNQNRKRVFIWNNYEMWMRHVRIWKWVMAQIRSCLGDAIVCLATSLRYSAFICVTLHYSAILDLRNTFAMSARCINVLRSLHYITLQWCLEWQKPLFSAQRALLLTKTSGSLILVYTSMASKSDWGTQL